MAFFNGFNIGDNLIGCDELGCEGQVDYCESCGVYYCEAGCEHHCGRRCHHDMAPASSSKTTLKLKQKESMKLSYKSKPLHGKHVPHEEIHQEEEEVHQEEEPYEEEVFQEEPYYEEEEPHYEEEPYYEEEEPYHEEEEPYYDESQHEEEAEQREEEREEEAEEREEEREEEAEEREEEREEEAEEREEEREEEAEEMAEEREKVDEQREAEEMEQPTVQSRLIGSKFSKARTPVNLSKIPDIKNFFSSSAKTSSNMKVPLNTKTSSDVRSTAIRPKSSVGNQLALRLKNGSLDLSKIPDIKTLFEPAKKNIGLGMGKHVTYRTEYGVKPKIPKVGARAPMVNKSSNFDISKIPSIDVLFEGTIFSLFFFLFSKKKGTSDTTTKTLIIRNPQPITFKTTLSDLIENSKIIEKKTNVGSSANIKCNSDTTMKKLGFKKIRTNFTNVKSINEAFPSSSGSIRNSLSKIQTNSSLKRITSEFCNNNFNSLPEKDKTRFVQQMKKLREKYDTLKEPIEGEFDLISEDKTNIILKPTKDFNADRNDLHKFNNLL